MYMCIYVYYISYLLYMSICVYAIPSSTEALSVCVLASQVLAIDLYALDMCLVYVVHTHPFDGAR